MNVRREPAYSNGLIGLKNVRDLFTTTSDRACVMVTTNANVNRLCTPLIIDHHLITWTLLVELGINCETICQLLHDKLHAKTVHKTRSKCTSTFISQGTQIFGGKNIPTLSYPPYSSDLTPCDFSLFTKLKSVLKGMRFDDLEEIKANTTHVLGGLL